MEISQRTYFDYYFYCVLILISYMFMTYSTSYCLVKNLWIHGMYVCNYLFYMCPVISLLVYVRCTYSVIGHLTVHSELLLSSSSSSSLLYSYYYYSTKGFRMPNARLKSRGIYFRSSHLIVESTASQGVLNKKNAGWYTCTTIKAKK
jgi:hypothetical protein